MNNKDLKPDIFNVIKRLPDLAVYILIFYYIYDSTENEISELCDKSLSAVCRELTQAHGILSAELQWVQIGEAEKSEIKRALRLYMDEFLDEDKFIDMYGLADE